MKTGIFSNLPDEPEPLDPDDDFEITYIFKAQFAGTCTLDREHEWRRGQKIGALKHASNPMLPVQGFACAECTKILPRAER